MPRAGNSGDRVNRHNHVKSGDLMLKSLLCTAVQGMLKSSNETAVARFYRKKEKTIGVAKAQVAAARKLACVVWAILTNRLSYIEKNEELTERKMASMNRSSKKTVAFSEQQLNDVTELLCAKTTVVDKLKEEVSIGSIKDEQEE